MVLIFEKKVYKLLPGSKSIPTEALKKKRKYHFTVQFSNSLKYNALWIVILKAAPE